VGLADVARRAPGGPPKAKPGAAAGPAAPQAPQAPRLIPIQDNSATEPPVRAQTRRSAWMQTTGTLLLGVQRCSSIP